MAKKDPTTNQTDIDKLLDELSNALITARERQEKLTTSIKVLSNLKNSPIDDFGDELTEEYKKACLEKCKQILAYNS